MSLYIDFNAIGKPKFKWPTLLLHPSIPKPMWGLAPRVVLGQEWWDVQRKAAYAKNNYCCWACGAPRTERRLLDAHECYLIDYVKGTMEMQLIAALCQRCHGFIHYGYSMATQGTLGLGRIWTHGIKTLGLKRVFPPELAFLVKTLESYNEVRMHPERMAPASKWRLILDGKEYKPDPLEFIPGHNE